MSPDHSSVPPIKKLSTSSAIHRSTSISSHHNHHHSIESTPNFHAPRRSGVPSEIDRDGSNPSPAPSAASSRHPKAEPGESGEGERHDSLKHFTPCNEFEGSLDESHSRLTSPRHTDEGIGLSHRQHASTSPHCQQQNSPSLTQLSQPARWSTDGRLTDPLVLPKMCTFAFCDVVLYHKDL